MRLALLSIVLLLLVQSSLPTETSSIDQILIEKNRKTIGSLFNVPSDITSSDSSRSDLNGNNEISAKRSLQKLLVPRVLQDTGNPKNSVGSYEHIQQNEDVPSYLSKMSSLTTEQPTPNTDQRHSSLGMFERFSMENSNPADENEAEYSNAFNDDVDISGDFFSDQPDMKKRNRLEDVYPEIMELPKQETRLPEIPDISDDVRDREPVRKKRNRGEVQEKESDIDCDENEQEDEYEYEEEAPESSLPRNERNHEELISSDFQYKRTATEEKKIEKRNGIAKTSAGKKNSGKSKLNQDKFSSSANNHNSKSKSHSRLSELHSSKDDEQPAIPVKNKKNSKKITNNKSKSHVEQTKLHPKSSKKSSKLIPVKKNLSKLDNSDANKIKNNRPRNKLTERNTTKKKVQKSIRLEIVNSKALNDACCKYQGSAAELDESLYNEKRDLQNTEQKQAVGNKNNQSPEINKNSQFSGEIKELLGQLIVKVGDLNNLIAKMKNEPENKSQFTDGSE